jgi:hypothetical protein
VIVIIPKFCNVPFLNAHNKLRKVAGLGGSRTVDEFDLGQRLDHEKQFSDSIRSCLPASHDNCKTYVPDAPPGSKKSAQRVALIAIPGDVRSSVGHVLKQIRDRHNRNPTSKDPEIDLIVRASVPPYGYGKTHGLTKIVRLQPESLLLEATSALQSAVTDTEKLDGSSPSGISWEALTLEDLKASLRLVLRFHCRLSHVSAHTAILSLNTSDLRSSRGNSASKQLQEFVAPHDGGGSVPESPNPSKTFASTDIFAWKLLSRIQAVHGVDVRSVLDEVLVDELSRTKNFSAWPCLSFWAVGDEPNVYALSPAVQKIARAVSPDCLGDAMANCWVGRDKCEAHGDGPCRDDGKQKVAS